MENKVLRPAYRKIFYMYFASNFPKVLIGPQKNSIDKNKKWV